MSRRDHRPVLSQKRLRIGDRVGRIAAGRHEHRDLLAAKIAGPRNIGEHRWGDLAAVNRRCQHNQVIILKICRCLRACRCVADAPALFRQPILEGRHDIGRKCTQAGAENSQRQPRRAFTIERL